MSEEQALPIDKRVTAQTEEQTLISLGLCITQLRVDGVDPADIVILSHLEAGSLAERAKEMVPELGDYLVPYDSVDEDAGVIRYTTIQAFAGQQKTAVIVTDVYDPDKQIVTPGTATLQAQAEACASRYLVTITYDPHVVID